ncbi:bacteriohemerythrin [uncultured Methanolobus sp.]|uniref:bacteriohemerythrin n=1 Tax=uncultured Methanolobus sp. TaxID=218300 RepID=UPI0029C9AB8C|nr:bacteriohemerythrin [uncultured Methanolobus sp.]
MALVTWSDKYSMQIKEIDDQHKVLVGMINELHDAMKLAKSKEVSLEIINKMAEYTKFHFSTEEKYMKRFAYPDYAEHKLEHENFVENVLKFKDDYEKGKAGISYDILNFLKDWLVGHIQDTDKKYAPLFIEKGLN